MSSSNDKYVMFGDKKFYIASDTGEAFEVLQDVSATGRERPWKDKKIENIKVQEIYKSLADTRLDFPYWYAKAERLASCGSRITFNVFQGENNSRVLKVINAESCRVRLCPLCSWRRSIKIQSQTRKIIEAMQNDCEYDYLLLTLTVPNCAGDLLSETIDNMMSGFDRFMRYKAIKSAVVGWYRCLEIVHNVEKYKFQYVRSGNGKKRKVYLFDDNGQRILNPWFDTYHPHLHNILAVPKGYFTSDLYIDHDELLNLWRKAMRDPTITQVDIRKVQPKKKRIKSGADVTQSFGDMIVSAIAEVCKYTVKSSDYICPWDWDLSCSAVETLDKALNHRRLVAFGGLMKEYHEKLNLDDVIDGNLIEDSENVNGELLGTLCAVWNAGYQQYFISE